MQEINSGECKVFMLKKYVKAAGFGDMRDICRFGFWRTNSQERKKAMADMMHEGIVEPVEVQGIKNTFYMPPEERSMLEPDPDLCDEVLLLAPLDKLIGNRKLISEVFGFDYAWEIYKIPAKRIFGCYVMPILHGDRFIGRLDPKLDRVNKKMTINALYLEGGKIDGETPLDELASAHGRFGTYHGASRIEVGMTDPLSLKSMLGGALAAQSLKC